MTPIQLPANIPLEVMCHERAMKPSCLLVVPLVNYNMSVMWWKVLHEITLDNTFYCRRMLAKIWYLLAEAGSGINQLRKALILT